MSKIRGIFKRSLTFILALSLLLGVMPMLSACANENHTSATYGIAQFLGVFEGRYRSTDGRYWGVTLSIGQRANGEIYALFDCYTDPELNATNVLRGAWYADVYFDSETNAISIVAREWATARPARWFMENFIGSTLSAGGYVLTGTVSRTREAGNIDFAIYRIEWEFPDGNDVIRVFLNGARIHFDQPPIIENEQILVPILPFAEAMGATVYWDDGSGTATMHFGENIDIIMERNMARAQKITRDGTPALNQPILLDVPMRIVDDRAFVPLRPLVDAFGLRTRVDWDESNRIINITMVDANSVVIPAEGGVFFATHRSFGNFVIIYLPIERAENYYSIISDVDPSIAWEGLYRAIEGVIQEKSIEAILAAFGFSMHPVLKIHFAVTTVTDIAQYLLTPITEIMKANELRRTLDNRVNIDGFIMVTIAGPSPTGHYETIFDAHNSKTLTNELSMGYFVAMSNLTENNFENMSRFEGALEVVIWSHLERID